MPFPVTPTLEPTFVYALEHGDHVYFFFREVSVEDARLGRVRSWAPGWVAGRLFWVLRTVLGLNLHNRFLGL